MAFLFLGRAEAAGHIEGVSYGVNQEGQLRVVIESDQALPYKTKILEGEAHIFVKGTLDPSIVPIYHPRESTIRENGSFAKDTKGHADSYPYG